MTSIQNFRVRLRLKEALATISDARAAEISSRLRLIAGELEETLLILMPDPIFCIAQPQTRPCQPRAKLKPPSR
jgi:hypothetical protein